MSFELNRPHWTSGDYRDFLEMLRKEADESYRDFSTRLTPGGENMLGIRIPRLRAIAKEIKKGNYAEYLRLEKGSIHEEIIIEGNVMAMLKLPYEEILRCMDYFSDKISNWAICDTVSFKELKKYLPQLMEDVDRFILSENPWKQRFGYGCLMGFCLTEEYIGQVLEKVQAVDSDFYYVQMMQAWLLATALAKCEEPVKAFLKTVPMNETVTKMTIRKIRESNRISRALKDECRQWK